MGAGEKAWEIYATRVPKKAKKITDRVVRGASTWGRDSRRRGEQFVKDQRKRLGV